MKSVIMPTSLNDLSAELQLKIIEELTHHEEDFPFGRNSHEGNSTPEEKFHNHALLNWSCTCSYFRNLLAPYIYRRIILRNTQRSGRSVTALASGQYGVEVKELHFAGWAPGDRHANEGDSLNGVGDEDKDETTDPEADKGDKIDKQSKADDLYRISYDDSVGVFPGVVDDLLSNLHQLPNLGLLTIRFVYDFSNYDEWNGLELCDEIESIEEVRAAEQETAWRALMAKTYTAVARNQSPNFKALELRDLPKEQVSTFNDTAFHTLLSQMDKFSLLVKGEDNGAGWCINTTKRYPDFTSRFGRWFFDHLLSATTFAIKSTQSGPIGLEGMNHAQLCLDKDHMPQLKSLSLEYIFICPEMIDFLTAHDSTLEQFILTSCYACPLSLAENGLHWHQFFDALNKANMRQLRRLEITPTNPPLTSDEDFDRRREDQEPRRSRQCVEP